MVDTIMERRQRQRNNMKPSKEEIRAIFHRLWTKDVGSDGYSKRDWRELRQMLFRLTGLEL